jgi:hypothetical protein
MKVPEGSLVAGEWGDGREGEPQQKTIHRLDEH